MFLDDKDAKLSLKIMEILHDKPMRESELIIILIKGKYSDLVVKSIPDIIKILKKENFIYEKDGILFVVDEFKEELKNEK